MANYIRLYDSASTFESDYWGAGYNEPWVSLTMENEEVKYNRPVTVDGHPYMDLGLPSGTLWATYNVGASSPEQYGNYYGWGDISARTSSAGYRFADGSKYNNTDQKCVLDLEDDVAHLVMGEHWRMPTYEQMLELKENTTIAWTNDYSGTSISGMVFTSKVNENEIFIPAAGSYWAGRLDGVGKGFHLWTCTRKDTSIATQSAYCADGGATLYFSISGGSNTNGNPFSIRGVVMQ